MQPSPGILVFFHCRVNPGYAIRKLESTFLAVARRLVATENSIHFAYTRLNGERPVFLPEKFAGGVIELDPSSSRHNDLEKIGQYVRRHNIRLAIGFDQPIRRPCYRPMRRAGLRHLVSYWGAPISSPNHGLRLMIKRLEVALAVHRPNHFVFESEAMRELAVRGRGIPERETSVCPTGVDPVLFAPAAQQSFHAHQLFGIPMSRRLVCYAGHMEHRKGVHVLIHAARHLIDGRGRRDLHLLILGNRPGEEKRFAPFLEGSPVSEHVTFGGYRADLPSIFPSCTLGVIPSAGWDSFPMSALEMASSGLPLIGSRLQGLIEAIDEGQTGLLFPPGDHESLAAQIAYLLDNPTLAQALGEAGRRRVVSRFTTDLQVERLASTIQSVAASRGGRQ